jgi:uncharacterized protein (DUF885 family)
VSIRSQETFSTEAKRFIDEMMEDSPPNATFIGDHRFDDRLSDLTPAAIADQRKRLGGWLDKFTSTDTAGWSVDARIDLRVVIQLIRANIRVFDRLRLFNRDPSIAANECLNGVYYLIFRDFAPLGQRLRSALSRLREIRRVLGEGRALIEAELVPPVWARVAEQTARQGIGLFASLLPSIAAGVPELQAEISVASSAAAGELTRYADWIRDQVAPKAKGSFAVGKALFNEMLRGDHMVGYDADELLKTGRELCRDSERQLQALAHSIDPGKTPLQILEESKKNHPKADELLDVYRKWMGEARRFVIEKDIATIPAGESIRVDPTPAFMRPLISYAAYMMPGFLEPSQPGVFIVTPVDEGADPEAAEKKLRGHPYADIPVTAIHEAYPGHHLQLVVANSLTSLPRKMSSFLSPLFIEGWAFYCEELMEKLGFIAEPIQKLRRLQGQLWRACRIIIDVSLHTGVMGVEEAVRFLVERAALEEGNARVEVDRYTQSPTQPQCYLMGKLEILKIVEEYRRRFPDSSLKKMHDDILRCGSLPPSLMRMKLFGEKAGQAAEQPAAAQPTTVKKPVARPKAAPTRAKKPALKKRASARSQKPAAKKATAARGAARKRKPRAPAKIAAASKGAKRAAAKKRPAAAKKPAVKRSASVKRTAKGKKSAARPRPKALPKRKSPARRPQARASRQHGKRKRRS